MPAPAVRAQINRRLQELYEHHLPVDEGRLDRYYESGRGYYPPREAGDERDRFAICLATTDGEVYEVGEYAFPFALHSISRVFSYGLALADHRREDILARVGVEPSGDAFNSIVFDERHHRPHNPMANAGALVTTDLVRGATSDRKMERILEVMRTCAGDQGLEVAKATFAPEMRTADRNRATALSARQFNRRGRSFASCCAAGALVFAMSLAGCGATPSGGAGTDDDRAGPPRRWRPNELRRYRPSGQARPCERWRRPPHDHGYGSSSGWFSRRHGAPGSRSSGA